MPRPVTTETSKIPAVPTGSVAVICVGLSTVKVVAAVLPKFTPVAPVKSVPVMTMLLPPPIRPRAGAAEVIVGAPGGALRVTLMV